MSCLSRLFANFDTLRFFNIRFSRYKFQVITTCQPFRMPIHNRFAIISSRASHYPLLFSLAHASKLASLRETFAGIAHGFVEIKGFEPLTPCLQGRCSPNWAIPPYTDNQICIIMEFFCLCMHNFLMLWGQEDSNLRPHAYQACALTSWAMTPFNLAATYFPIPSPA